MDGIVNYWHCVLAKEAFLLHSMKDAKKLLQSTLRIKDRSKNENVSVFLADFFLISIAVNSMAEEVAKKLPKLTFLSTTLVVFYSKVDTLPMVLDVRLAVKLFALTKFTIAIYAIK